MASVITRGARSTDSRTSTAVGFPRADTQSRSLASQPPRQCRHDVRAGRACAGVRRRGGDRLWPGGANSHEIERRGRRRRARRADAGDVAAKHHRRPRRRRQHVQRPDRRHPGPDRQRDPGDGHRHGRRHCAHAQCRSQLLFSVNTIFAQVLQVNALQVSGVSEASAQAPPNIDFYVLLDNSPSMALPATAAGITQMEGLTTTKPRPRSRRGGCAFACHQASTNNSRQRRTILAPTALRRPCQLPAVDNDGHLHTVRRKHGAQIDNYAARPQEQHHAAPGRAEQRRFDPASDGVDDLAVEPVRHAAEISVFNLFDG